MLLTIPVASSRHARSSLWNASALFCDPGRAGIIGPVTAQPATVAAIAAKAISLTVLMAPPSMHRRSRGSAGLRWRDRLPLLIAALHVRIPACRIGAVEPVGRRCRGCLCRGRAFRALLDVGR